MRKPSCHGKRATIFKMIKLSWSKHKKFLVPFLIFLCSLSLRLSLISKGPYNVDTLNLVIQAEKTLETHRLHYLFGSGYPLTVLLAAFFMFFVNLFLPSDPVFAVNLMSVVLSSISVLFLFYIVQELFGFTEAIFSSVMFSLCPVFFGLSVYGKSHTPSLFFLLLSLCFLIQHFKSGRAGPLCRAGIFFGAMGAARFQDMILLLLAFCFLLLFYPGSQECSHVVSWKKRFYSLGVFLFFMAGIVVLFHVPLFLQKSGQYSNNLTRFLRVGLKDSFLGAGPSSLIIAGHHLSYTLTFPGVIIACAGLVKIFQRKKAISIFLVLWIAVPLLFYGNHRFIINPRFLVVLLPPLIIGQSYILAYWARKNSFVRGCVYVFFCVILFACFSRIYPNVKFRHETELLPDFVRWVEQKTEADSRIIVADEALFFTYYTKQKILRRPTHNIKLSPEELMRFKKTVDNFIESGVPVYATSASIFAYDRDEHFSSFFLENYDGVLIGQHYYEDWHLGSLNSQVYFFDLYRVIKR